MKHCQHQDAVVVYQDNDVCPLCVATASLDRKESLVNKFEAELDLVTHDLETVRNRDLVV